MIQKDQILKELADKSLYILQDDQPEMKLFSNQQFVDVSRENKIKIPEYMKQQSLIPTNLNFLPHDVQDVLRSRSEMMRSQQQTQSEEISPFMSDQEEKEVKLKIRNIKKLKSDISIKEIKILLMTSLGTDLCNQVLNIALNDEEKQVALVIALFYRVPIFHEQLYRALCTNHILFIKMVFTSKKFHLLSIKSLELDHLTIKKKLSIGLTLETLMTMIRQISSDVKQFIQSDQRIPNILQREREGQQVKEDAQEIMRILITEWPINECFTNDIIKILLLNRYESLAWKQGRILYAFKLLTDCNIKLWTFAQVDSLLQSISSIATNEYEKNLITAVHNPILVLALSCELLVVLSKTHAYLKNQCRQTTEKFVLLVQRIIENQDDLIVLEMMLTELDHKKRSSLQIINKLKMSQMISNPKVTTIMDEQWTGKDNIKCNGKLSDFSCLYQRMVDEVQYNNISFIYDEFGRRTISNKLKFWDVVKGSFQKPKISEQRYWFQYNYRHTSIDYLYWKEFSLSFGLVILFQYIGYSYLNNFKLANIEINGYKKAELFEDNEPELIKHLQNLINEYSFWTQVGLFMCFTIFVHVFQKFQLSRNIKIPMSLDLWILIDLLTAVCNTFCLYITGRVDPEMILDKLTKQQLDFYVCAVVTVTWFRFFAYFLILKKVSKLLITLVTMIYNTLSFFFMFVCYIVLAAFIFNMRYGDVAPEYYGNLFLSARSLFDEMESNYEYLDVGKFQKTYDFFFIIHQLISRIFLLNYLVAVLTTIYQFMIIDGEYRGFFICIGIGLYDTGNFIQILLICDDDKKEIKEAEKKEKDLQIKKVQINILNEVVEGMKSLHKELEGQYQMKKQSRKLSSNLTLNRNTTNKTNKNKESIVQKLSDIKTNQLSAQKTETNFTLDKDLIIINWIKLRRNRIQISNQKQFVQAKIINEPFIRKSGVLYPPLLQPRSKLSSQAFNNQRRLTNMSMVSGTLSRKILQSVLEAGSKMRRISSTNQTNINRKFSTISKFVKDYSKRKSSNSNKFQQAHLKHDSQINSQRMIRPSATPDFEQQSEKELLKKLAAVDDNILSFIENFLCRFIFVSKYQGHNQVNLKLCLSALPQKLTLENFHKVQMINFVKVQMALVSFQNQKSDQLFNYYDQRNKARIYQLNTQALETSGLSREILTFSFAVKNKLVKLFKLEREFRKIEEKKKQEQIQNSQVIRINIQQHPEAKRSNNTLASEQTNSLYPVIEESELGEYELGQSSNIQEFLIKGRSFKMSSGPIESGSQFSNPDEGASYSRHQRFKIDQSGFGISEEESETYSSFTSFSDVIKEESESNLSSNKEKSI